MYICMYVCMYVCIINIIINILWVPLRSHISRTSTLAHHLSLGSSMVRASYLSSGCELDLRLGLRNRFSEDRARRTFIYPLKYKYRFDSTEVIDVKTSAVLYKNRKR